MVERLENPDYALWNVVGTWLSGLATLAAVLVSLYFAIFANRPKLHVRAGIRALAQMGKSEHPEYMMIMVTNTGDRTVIVDGFGWSMGWGKWGPLAKRSYMQLPSMLPMEDRIPTTLPTGQVARYMFELAGKHDWIKMIAGRIASLPQWRRRLYLRTLKVHISTTVGTSFSIGVEKAVINRLIAASRAFDA